MTSKITVKAGDIELQGKLFNTSCAKAVEKVLPITTKFNTWGDEFYFSIGIEEPLDRTAKTVVEVGTIGYWPPGDALAIFFGRTPSSTNDKPVAASEVNIVGELKNAGELKKVVSADKIIIEKK